MMRLFSALLCCVLASCGAAEYVTAPPEAIERALYVAPESYVELITTFDNRSGAGSHSAIVASGSQVAIYDPAGTFTHPEAPEANDVHYGFTPNVRRHYEAHHARTDTSVRIQRLPVPREFADAVLARMEAQGPSPKALCARNTSAILRDFPEFAHLPSTLWPGRLMSGFGKIPGVTARRVDPANLIAKTP